MTTQGTTEPVKSGAAVGERRLRRDAEENRRRLLEAADELFAESGFEATMDQIAARAGLGVGTAYRRFPNKEALLAALFQDRIAELVEVAERALAEEDPWQGMVTYLEESISRQACDRGLKELVLTSPRSREYVNEARSRLKPLLDALVERAHRAHCLRPGIESTDIVMVQLMLATISEPPQGQGPEVWRRFLPLVLDGLRGEGTKPLPGTALSDEQLDASMEGTVKVKGSSV